MRNNKIYKHIYDYIPNDTFFKITPINLLLVVTWLFQMTLSSKSLQYFCFLLSVMCSNVIRPVFFCLCISFHLYLSCHTIQPACNVTVTFWSSCNITATIHAQNKESSCDFVILQHHRICNKKISCLKIPIHEERYSEFCQSSKSNGRNSSIRRPFYVDITTLNWTPYINKFHVILTFFFNAPLINKHWMSVRSIIFNIMLVDEKLTFFLRFSFDVISMDRKWTYFWCCFLYVILMDKKSRSLWCAFLIQFWLMKNRLKFDILFQCIFERKNLLWLFSYLTLISCWHISFFTDSLFYLQLTKTNDKFRL